MPGEQRRNLKILVLCKRQYTNKDLLDDKYGRLREIPLGLADLGHDVTGIALSYRKRDERLYTDVSDRTGSRVQWHSVNLGRWLIPGLVRYRRKVMQLVASTRPDVIVAMSDAYHIVYGSRIARKARAKFVADLYDNFESFGATKLPGVRAAFIRAVSRADKVVCVSRPLADYVSSAYGCTGEVLVIENGYNAELFRPMDKPACRKQFGLSDNARIIGTAGAIAKSRDIQTLLKAAGTLGSRYQNLELAVAGQIDSELEWPDNIRVHKFPNLPHADVPCFLNTLDVAIVPNKDSEFGRYCFPQKAVEILACRVPVVAASVGTMKILFENNPDLLYRPGDSRQLADKVEDLLTSASGPGVKTDTWDIIADRYGCILSG